jgi:hypothetical protein
MADNATVAIPNDVIVPILQARIQAMIVEALGGQAQLIEAAVVAALGQKVDVDGKVSSYRNDFTFLQVTANQFIRETAKGALKEYLEKQKPAIAARVVKELEKKHTALAAALVDGLAKAIDTTYGFSLSVNFKDKKD